MDIQTDLSGMFPDFNFKLVVLNSLLDQHPSFEEELDTLKRVFAASVNPSVWRREPIPEVLSFFAALRLTSEDLAKVTRLDFDGGEPIYRLLKPDWDGEEDLFDVTSVQGAELLPNLQTVYWCAMCDPGILDIFRKQGIAMNI